MDGYIIAFDKHFNLLMTHVSEEYELSSEGDGEAEQGQAKPGGDAPKGRKLHRYLPQVLVRVDGVVCVYKYVQPQV